MKLNIITRVLMAAGCVAAFSACDEDSWNKENLDGYESDGSERNPTVVETREYTLTDKDYEYIANNSTNKAMAEAGGYADQLKALPNTRVFTGDLNPEKLIPAFLSTQNFPYYILNDDSYVKVTYNVAAAPDPVMTGASAAKTLTVGEEDYANTVWESDENFINAFAPSKQPSRYLPGILKTQFPDAVNGDYVLVTYDMATQEPVFGNVGGEDPDVPVEFEMSSVLGDVKDQTDYVVMGVVTGACGNGFTITDKTGTVFVYMGSGYDVTTYPIGTQMKMTAATSAYKGLMQFKNAEIEVIGQQEYTYPNPVIYDRAGLDAVMNDINDKPCTYVQIAGKVSVSGNNVNINLSGEGTAVGSLYYATPEQKAIAVDGADVTVRGWLCYRASTKYCNIIATSVEAGLPVNAASKYAPVAPVPVEQENAMYVYDGSRWKEAENFCVLNTADYTAMDQKYGNLSGDLPATLLPIYLKNKYPYATAEAVKYVGYKYYNSSDKSTTNRVNKFVFNGSEWAEESKLSTGTSQFVRVDGAWMFDPSVVLTLTTNRNDAVSTAYYTACVDYVRDVVPDGAKYITSYGNNEYWAGASWYQNNIDLRPGKARTQYEEGWKDYDNDQIVETMKKRFVEESLVYALTKLNPDANTNPDVDVFYTVNFYAYTGVTTGPHSAKYRVTGPGQFEFVEVNWNFE